MPRLGSCVVHLELHTGDRAEAESLYRTTCGWQGERVPVGDSSYLALDLGAGLSGGIVECESRRSLWLPYVQVDSVTRTTESARQTGARVLLEPREGPSGWRSVVTTAAGAEIAFWQPKR